jgi:hypothetical protein
MYLFREDTLRGLGGREGRRPRHPPQGRRGTDEDDTAPRQRVHGGDHLPGDEQGSQGIDAPNSLKRPGVISSIEPQEPEPAL